MSWKREFYPAEWDADTGTLFIGNVIPESLATPDHPYEPPDRDALIYDNGTQASEEDWADLARIINSEHDLRAENECLRAAVNLAYEWAAKYPLQGYGSEADRYAAKTVYDACQEVLGIMESG